MIGRVECERARVRDEGAGGAVHAGDGEGADDPTGNDHPGPAWTDGPHGSDSAGADDANSADAARTDDADAAGTDDTDAAGQARAGDAGNDFHPSVVPDDEGADAIPDKPEPSLSRDAGLPADGAAPAPAATSRNEQR